MREWLTQIYTIENPDWKLIAFVKEAEVLDEGMLALEPDLAGRIGVVDLRRFAMKRQAGLGLAVADARESPHEVEVPGRAAEFAVGDDAETGRLLFCDQVADRVVLDGREFGSGDRSRLEVGARATQRCRAQEAADHVESVRGFLIVCDGHRSLLHEPVVRCGESYHRGLLFTNI